MTPDGLSDLLACVAAFGSSLDESFDPTRFLAEFSAHTQRLVPHDYMLIALREDDGKRGRSSPSTPCAAPSSATEATTPRPVVGC